MTRHSQDLTGPVQQLLRNSVSDVFLLLGHLTHAYLPPLVAPGGVFLWLSITGKQLNTPAGGLAGFLLLMGRPQLGQFLLCLFLCSIFLLQAAQASSPGRQLFQTGQQNGSVSKLPAATCTPPSDCCTAHYAVSPHRWCYHYRWQCCCAEVTAAALITSCACCKAELSANHLQAHQRGAIRSQHCCC